MYLCRSQLFVFTQTGRRTQAWVLNRHARKFKLARVVGCGRVHFPGAPPVSSRCASDGRIRNVFLQTDIAYIGRSIWVQVI